MSHIHIPESELNRLARILWHHAGKQVGYAVGFQVGIAVYEQIKNHLERDGHHHLILSHGNSPQGYVLLTYR
jgi:hypothetical protein